jgi:hypothetical protein
MRAFVSFNDFIAAPRARLDSRDTGGEAAVRYRSGQRAGADGADQQRYQRPIPVEQSRPVPHGKPPEQR